ncbi:branched-chain amino acid ABC transporter permease [Acidisphaera rubrifaciens]|uniref:ABC transporter branched-chain amino acid permease n=1 Tax=Acidisphaera rubrifaciens HS-AP3 TaxID=1231350 RepID=A0A0D6P666_9PROT|nr:branched-chain amino acid ABC transporter permease [Acidisphaera rubrifaciens]GAN76836.1 ABC transporter branched-chain amino acid permease [Acidisphaera rubrifaciens HS-AP3]
MRRDTIIAVLALAVLLAVPYVLPSRAFADFAIRASAMALFATSLNLLVGYTGLVSFGHGMFYGLGAYAFALTMQRTSLPLPVGVLAALGITLAAAVVVGAICIRLRLIYFAFVTLAMQMLAYSIVIAWEPLTGGDQGLQGGIPRRVVAGLDLGSQWTLYGVSVTVAVLGLLAMRHLTQTPFGLSLRMLRDNEARAGFLGITVWRTKLIAFVVAAGFAGLGGVLSSLFVSGAYPELINWPESGQGIFAIMLGGIDSFLGPLVGTAILLGLNDVVTRYTEYYGLALGIIILIFALGLRRGVLDVAWPGLRPGRRAPAAARGVKAAEGVKP